MFNLSFSIGCVPDQFKIANTIPVHKKDSITCGQQLSTNIVAPGIQQNIKKIDFLNIITVNLDSVKSTPPNRQFY